MATLTLRPNGAGTDTGITLQYPSSTYQWDKLDETSQDGSATYVYHNSTAWRTITCALPSHTNQWGKINSVTVYAVCMGYTAASAKTKLVLRTHGAYYYGSVQNLASSWVLYSEVFDTNPANLHSWTWAEIDDMEAGVSLYTTSPTEVYCTQVYVVVDYEEPPVPTTPARGSIDINCQQYGYVLTRDYISTYSKALTDGEKPTDILTDFLAYQASARVTLGGVDGPLDYPIAISVTNLDIWSACKLVRDTVGGYLSVEVDEADLSIRKLWLRQNIGESKGQQIRLGKNLSGIKYTVDYSDFCNRLYPIGSGISLTDKTFSRVSVDQWQDSTYAYIKLKEQFGAYKDWATPGAALPANVTIEAMNGAWDSPTGDIATTGWTNPAYGRDNNTVTVAYHYYWGMRQWTQWLAYSIGATLTTSIKYYAIGSGQDYFYLPTATEIEIYYGAAWHNVYSGTPTVMDAWTTVSFAEQTITGVRIRFYNAQTLGLPAPQNYSAAVPDIYVWNKTGWTDYTSSWKQGDDERTCRIAVASYTSGDYVISYTHAPYLIDLENITNRDEIYSKKTDISTSVADSLLAQGRVKLTEMRLPLIGIEIDVVDLSIEEGHEWEELELGSTVTVIDEDLGIEESANIVSISKPDLHHPEQIAIEVANKSTDIIDYLKS